MKNIKQITLIFLAYYGITCFSNIYFIFGPFYEKMGATPQQTGLFLSLFYFVMLICRPLGSKVMEKFDIRRALVGSSALCAAASVGVALSLHCVPLLLFFRALTGLCVSVFAVSAIAAQSLLLDEKARGFGFALFTTGSLLPMATIVPFCDWLQQNNYDTLYLWLPAATALLCTAVSWPVKNLNYHGEHKKAWGSYADLLKTPAIPALLATAMVMSLADAMTLSVASLANERFITVSAFMIASSLAGIAIRTIAFSLIAKIPRVHLAAPAAALMGAGLIGLSLSSGGAAFMAFGALFGIGIGIGFPVDLALVGDLLAPEYRPEATGLVLLVIDIGWMISPLIFGFFSPVIGATWTFRVMGLFVVSAAAALYLQFWRKCKIG